jgi:signal transduction histidine kinase
MGIIQEGLNILFVETLVFVVVVGIMTFYISDILSNKKTYSNMIYHYTKYHITTIMLLIFNYLLMIAPLGFFKDIMLVFSYTAVMLFCVQFFKYGHFNYYKREMYLKNKILVALLPSAGFIASVTNPWSNLLVVSFSKTDYHPGILYHIILVPGILLTLVSVFFIYAGSGKKSRNPYVSGIILSVSMITFIGYYLTNSKIIDTPIDITPYLVLIIFTLSYLGTSKFGFFRVVTPQILKSLEMYDEGIIAFDKFIDIIYLNEPAKKISKDMMIRVLEICKNEIERLKDKNSRLEKHIVIYDQQNSIYISGLYSRYGRLKGYLCLIHDDSRIIGAINDLKEKNQQLEEMNRSIREFMEYKKELAILEERNRMAKEIHDILGHSLVLAQQTIESNSIIMRNDPKRALDRLLKAVSDIESGFGEINSSTKENMNREDEASYFRKKLSDIVERVGEVGVNVDISAVETVYSCSRELLHCILRVIQEAITNAIKHGNAKNVSVSVRKQYRELFFIIVDDGKGVNSISKGNGLFGMESRVSKLGGSIHFGNFDGTGGFVIRGSIPLNTKY